MDGGGARVARLGWAGWRMEVDGRGREEGSADGGGRRRGRLARMVGVDLLTSARPETIHCGSDNVVNFCSKSGLEKKTQEWRPLP